MLVNDECHGNLTEESAVELIKRNGVTADVGCDTSGQYLTSNIEHHARI